MLCTLWVSFSAWKFMEILSSARQEIFWIWFIISPAAISPAAFLLQRRCLVIFGCGCWETAKELRRAFWELASSPTCRRQVDFGVLWCHVLARFSKLQRSWFLYEWRGLMPSMSFANSLPRFDSAEWQAGEPGISFLSHVFPAHFLSSCLMHVLCLQTRWKWSDGLTFASAEHHQPSDSLSTRSRQCTGEDAAKILNFGRIPLCVICRTRYAACLCVYCCACVLCACSCGGGFLTMILSRTHLSSHFVTRTFIHSSLVEFFLHLCSLWFPWEHEYVLFAPAMWLMLPFECVCTILASFVAPYDSWCTLRLLHNTLCGNALSHLFCLPVSLQCDIQWVQHALAGQLMLPLRVNALVIVLCRHCVLWNPTCSCPQLMLWHKLHAFAHTWWCACLLDRWPAREGWHPLRRDTTNLLVICLRDLRQCTGEMLPQFWTLAVYYSPPECYMHKMVHACTYFSHSIVDVALKWAPGTCAVCAWARYHFGVMCLLFECNVYLLRDMRRGSMCMHSSEHMCLLTDFYCDTDVLCMHRHSRFCCYCLCALWVLSTHASNSCCDSMCLHSHMHLSHDANEGSSHLHGIECRHCLCVSPAACHDMCHCLPLNATGTCSATCVAVACACVLANQAGFFLSC